MCIKIIFPNIHTWGKRRRSILEFSQPQPTEDAGEGPEEKTQIWTKSGDTDPASPSKSLSGTQTCSSPSVDCNIVCEESSVSTGGTDPNESMRTPKQQIKVTKRILAILVSENTRNLVSDQYEDTIDMPQRGTETAKSVSKGDIEYFQALRAELKHLKCLLSRQQKEEIIKGEPLDFCFVLKPQYFEIDS
jgi:hypothetical protein